MCVFSAIGVTFFLRGKQPERLSWNQFLKRFDWIGTFLLSASLSSLLFGVTAGGVLHPWRSANTLVPLIIGIIGLMTFCIYEQYTAREPLIPLRIFATRTLQPDFSRAGFLDWFYGVLPII